MIIDKLFSTSMLILAASFLSLPLLVIVQGAQDDEDKYMFLFGLVIITGGISAVFAFACLLIRIWV